MLNMAPEFLEVGMLFGNKRDKVYEFEGSDDYISNRFFEVLEQFDVYGDGDIVPEIEGSSRIRFVSTPEQRMQIEYVFRRRMRLDRLYLLNLDCYQNNAEKFRIDRYMIL